MAGAVFLLSSVDVWMKKTITLRYKTCHCEAAFSFLSSFGTEAFFLKKSWFVFTLRPGEIIFGDGCSKCVAVLATTPLTVWTTHVTL